MITVEFLSPDLAILRIKFIKGSCNFQEVNSPNASPKMRGETSPHYLQWLWWPHMIYFNVFIPLEAQITIPTLYSLNGYTT